MDKTVTIRGSETRYYYLLWPEFLTLPKANLRKLLKIPYTLPWYPENQEAIDFLDREFPILIESIGSEEIPNAKTAWDTASKEYQNGFLTLDHRLFPPGTKEEKDAEKARRKRHNDSLMNKVKIAKAEYEKQNKRLIRVKEIYEIYKSQKR